MGVVKYTGPVASFHCPTNAEIRSLKVHFSPKQEGTGDPSPENIREIVGWDGVEVSQHNKNIYSKDNVIPHDDPDCEWNGIMTGIKQKFAVNAWPRWTFLAPAVPNATYYWTVAGYEVGFLDKDENVLTYKNSWNTSKIVAPANAVYIYHTWIKNEPMSQEQLDAAFQTYDLYYDISPTVFESQNSKKTNYEFGTLGKNKLNNNIAFWEVGSMNAAGGKNGRTTRIRTKDFISAFPNTTYTISISSGYSFAWDEFYSGTHKYYYDWQSGSYTFTTHSDVNQLFFIIKKDDTTNITPSILENDCHIQLELGSTATTYEPYDPKHTVYGGWVDLISGEIAETYKCITVDSTLSVDTPNLEGNEPWKHRWSIRKWDYNKSKWLFQSNSGILYCDRLNKVTSATSNGEIYGVTVETRIYLYDDEITTIEEFHTKYDGMKLCAPANEPYDTYHLAPTQLQTFLGQNNIWSNADYVEVEYDLHETQDILARKQFIIANQPHIETPAPALLQNFSTDMVAPLKECKVYFNPIQEGSGDASPNNVRAISGWNQITYNYTAKSILSFLTQTKQYNSTNTYNGYGGWCTEQKIPDRTKTYVYSVYIDNTNGIEPADARIWHRNINNSTYVDKTVTEGNYIPVGSSGWSRVIFDVLSKPNTYYMAPGLYMKGNVIASNPMVEIASTASEYEPYKGSIHTIDWSNDIGMVPGGYIDLINGKLVQTHKKVTIGELSWRTVPSLGEGGWATDSHIPSDMSRTAMPISTIYKTINWQHSWSSYQSEEDYSISRYSPSDNLCIVIKDSRYSTVADFIAAQGNTEIIYELATPIEYSLTTTQLKTLRGINNIWSNTNGPIELKYWTH